MCSAESTPSMKSRASSTFLSPRRTSPASFSSSTAGLRHGPDGPRRSELNDFDDQLRRELADIHAQGLSRALRQIDSAQGPHITAAGRTCTNFSSNDYLGLANHPALKEAAIQAIGKFGAG